MMKIKTNLITSPYQLDMKDIEFIFDDASKTMAMLINVEQDGIPFIAAYVYSYTALTTSNITSFYKNRCERQCSTVVENEMAPLLDYIEGDSFKIDYFTGSNPVLGQFTSRDPHRFFLYR